MSMQEMSAFLEKAQADETVAKQLFAILDHNESDVIYSKVVSLANDNGFTVTESDVKETQAQFAKAIDGAEAGEGDLGDDDLDNVSGGLGFGAIQHGMNQAMNGLIKAGQIGAIGIDQYSNGLVTKTTNLLKNW
ncbi:Nif11-like leader peptide family natural product precursor [Nisaea sp.]|uniref:Nif11-like leader peptide family natural product precursor n=1 Tax=Nisaea sp. TaxID=2024842 RepID=UPI003B52D7BC